MPTNIKIIPAILATSEKQYQDDITKLASAQYLQNGWVHIDFMDNIFVQNRTIEPEVVKGFPTNFHKEAHLMVAYPKVWIDELVDTSFERIIFHIESENINKAIDYAKGKNLEVGLALRSETDLEKVEPFIDTIDVVMLMGVVPGLQGQQFITQSISKLKKLQSKNWPVRIGIDGGINNSNIKDIANAGADYVIVGSYLLQGDVDENLENLWGNING